MLDIGLSNFSLLRSIFGYSHPAPASHPAQTVTPHGLMASYTTFTETRYPLQNLFTAAVVGFTTDDGADVTGGKLIAVYLRQDPLVAFYIHRKREILFSSLPNSHYLTVHEPYNTYHANIKQIVIFYIPINNVIK
jgi:hypothetical protein